MFDKDTEPLRRYVYGALAAIAAVLVAYGVIDSSFMPVILAAVAALLGVPAVETARARVTSPATLRAMQRGGEEAA